jgi:hypothetical protein
MVQLFIVIIKTLIMNRLIAGALFIALVSCGDDTTRNDNSVNKDKSPVDTTVAHPDGVINGSVISTDTAAMRTK